MKNKTIIMYELRTYRLLKFSFMSFILEARHQFTRLVRFQSIFTQSLFVTSQSIDNHKRVVGVKTEKPYAILRKGMGIFSDLNLLNKSPSSYFLCSKKTKKISYGFFYFNPYPLPPVLRIIVVVCKESMVYLYAIFQIIIKD